MGTSFFLARRYLVSKKSKNAINYITGVSVILVAFVSMSLIITLSVFNGLTGLITSMYNTFDPDIKITQSNGRVFNSDSVAHYLQTNKDVAAYTSVLEEDVLFVYNQKQLVGRIKGVDSQYTNVHKTDSMLVSGEFVLEEKNIEFACVGQGVAMNLEIGLHYREVLQIYAPERLRSSSSLNPMDDYNEAFAYPRAVFTSQMDIDNKYCLTSISLVQNLFKYKKNEASAIEISCNSQIPITEIANNIQTSLGSHFSVKTRDEQHEFLYKVTESEKLITFFIITLILIIASFSIVGALTMLIIDKKKDIKILRSLGASVGTIKKIFIIEGWLISCIGGILGVCIGVILTVIQQEYGILSLGNTTTFVVDSYPVKIFFSDIAYVLLMVFGVGFFTAYIPAHYIFKKHILS